MANRTLESLATRLNRLADGIDDELKAAKTEAGMAVVTHLANNTPVDTSEAISNWQVEPGTSANGGPIGPHVPGLGGSTKGASVSVVLADARAAFDAAPANQPLVIFNAAAHIRPLNEGSSRQHPGGFVEAAILVGRSVLRRRKWFRGN